MDVYSPQNDELVGFDRDVTRKNGELVLLWL
jgi:hypothetical protein